MQYHQRNAATDWSGYDSVAPNPSYPIAAAGYPERSKAEAADSVAPAA